MLSLRSLIAPLSHRVNFLRSHHHPDANFPSSCTCQSTDLPRTQAQKMSQRSIQDDGLSKRLDATHEKIEQICKISGNAGLSVGILHHGEVIHLANYGYRDVDGRLKPDSDTVYHLGSLSKFVTSATLATFVEEGQLAWESRVADVLPAYWQRNKDRQEHANIIDILAHRMALEMRVPYWAQMQNQLLLPASEGVNVLGALESTGKFRKDLKYNNWTYGVAGDIIEKLSGVSLEQCVKDRITNPLGLKRTTMGTPPSDNYAKSYMCLNDGTPYEVPPPALTSGGIVGGCGALKSSVNDMLILYESVLKSYQDQQQIGVTKTAGSPFVQTGTMFSPHITKNKTSYGLGWFLTELPGEIGWIGLNEARVKTMPQIARGTGPTQIAYHNGNMPGALSSVHLIPETHTAIAVFANSIPFSDVPDWVGGLLLEAVLGTSNPNDFVALAKESRETTLAKMEATRQQLQQERDTSTPVKPLNEYVGKYYNNIGNFYLDVTEDADGLKMRVQGLDNTCYELSHFYNDTFAWECDREKEVRNVMFPSWYDEMHKVQFSSGQDGGAIDRTFWKYARDVPTPGETFMKSLDGQPLCWQPPPSFAGLARI